MRRKGKDTMAAEEMKGPNHRFILSNHYGVVLKYCVLCGLSYTLVRHQRTTEPVWIRIREDEGDTTFSKPCPAEGGSESLFPYHQFILSSSHNNNPADPTVIRFCVHCGLSHSWQSISRSYS